MDCEVCLEAFSTSPESGPGAAEDRRPRLLPCGHSACPKCVQRIIEQRGKRSICYRDGREIVARATIPCPFDNTEVHIPGADAERLPVNYSLMDMLEESKELERRKKRLKSSAASSSSAAPATCIECQRDQPTTYCPLCDGDYCKACAEAVHTPRALQPHRTAFVAVEDKLPKARPLPLCPLHGDPLKLWCKEEGVQICALCVAIGVHKGHQANTIALVAESERKELDKALSEAEDKKVAILRQLEALNQGIGDLQENALTLKERIATDVKTISKYLDLHARSLTLEIDARTQRATKKLTAFIDHRTHLLERLQSSVSTAYASLSLENGPALPLPSGPLASAASSSSDPVHTAHCEPSNAQPMPIQCEEIDADIALIRANGVLVQELQAMDSISALPRSLRVPAVGEDGGSETDELLRLLAEWRASRSAAVRKSIPGLHDVVSPAIVPPRPTAPSESAATSSSASSSSVQAPSAPSLPADASGAGPDPAMAATLPATPLRASAPSEAPGPLPVRFLDPPHAAAAGLWPAPNPAPLSAPASDRPLPPAPGPAPLFPAPPLLRLAVPEHVPGRPYQPPFLMFADQVFTSYPINTS